MINIFAKKITSDDYKVIERMKKFFSKELGKEIEFNTIDIISYESPLVENYSILCGNIDHILEFGTEICTIRIASLPNLINKEKNKEAVVEFKKLINHIKNNNGSSNDSNNIQKIYVEKDNIKVGNNDIVDIQITEKEAEYLKKIKTLLDGSKIIITKGNLKLEIE